MSKNFNNAIVSVYDKNRIVDLAKIFNELNIKILASGSTYELITKAGLAATKISDYTNFPEILAGRVKTLHPKIYGGILARTDQKDDLATLKEFGIEKIDIVVCNLYPFTQVVEEGANDDTILENIDIGGVSLIRAGAKNYKDVLTVVDANNYDKLIEIVKRENATEVERLFFAKEAFKYVARYDLPVYSYFSDRCLEQQHERIKFADLLLSKPETLRYGENTHQQAVFFTDPKYNGLSAINGEKIWGKEISYNNYIDLDSAVNTAFEFSEKTAVIIKHTNPCGVGSALTMNEALIKAIETDPVSMFGGVIGLNSTCDSDTAVTINKYFIEAVVAVDFTEEALDILKKKKNIRILKLRDKFKMDRAEWEIKSLRGGILAQEIDIAPINDERLKCVTVRKPTPDEIRALIYGMKVARNVKSNAIVLSLSDRAIGIGAGQMSRIDSVRIAIEKSSVDTKGSVLASDGFFPFTDSVEIANKAGITAIIQPGGSIRDNEVIDACNKYNIAMVFTGYRHFRH